MRCAGWISKRRDHGKLVFFDVRDRSGSVQCVVLPDAEEAYEMAKDVRAEYLVAFRGLVKERPQKAAKEADPLGGIEIEIRELEVLSKPSVDLPVDVSQEDMGLNLDTLLNYRHLTIRNEKVRSIFELSSAVLEAYASVLRERHFSEIKSPKILEAATEGGANFFKVHYFDREAFLAQSPQFYKQAGVGAFERVFEIGPVFRAEPHFTTRHVNEYISLDAEMGFIDGFEEVMDELESVVMGMMERIRERELRAFGFHGTSIPESVAIPRMTLAEAVEILKKEYGKELEELDIDAEGERMIGEYAKEKYGSDFVFLTHYPVSIRPFYAMPSEDGETTQSFDLLFRGLEIATGGQRIHRVEQLEESIRRHGLDPEDFSSYLDMFRFGMPPHGGWGMGSERIVQKLLGLGSIKEAVLYPRDVKRLSP